MLKPITIQGVTYPSMTDAADYFGVSISAISVAKSRDRLDTVGSGSRSYSTHTGGNTQPVVILGVEYLSRNHAAEAIGETPPRLATALSIMHKLGIDYTKPR